MKNKILWTTLLMGCLLFPMGASAVTEGVVEAAPAVEMEDFAAEATKASYLPDASYYADYGDWKPAWENAEEWVESGFDGECYHDVEQRPRLTAGEILRAKALLAAYRAGEIAYTGESVLEKMEDVIVGVYALDPAEYDGERVYVLLPGPCLTDEQLLSIIDAYAQLGLTFDPEALSDRNCARGGGIESNRFFADEERERYSSLSRMIRYGILDTAQIDPQALRTPRLNRAYYCGLPDFTIKPYRPMTDEELAALLVFFGVADETGMIDHDDVEKRARAALAELGCPLSMTLEHIYTEGSYLPVVHDAQGNCDYDWQQSGRAAYGAAFNYTDTQGMEYHADVDFDKETDEIISVSFTEMPALQKECVNYAGDTACLLAAQRYAGDVIGVKDAVFTLAPERTWTNYGECADVRAILDNRYVLHVYVGADDAAVHGARIERSMMVDDAALMMPPNG